VVAALTPRAGGGVEGDGPAYQGSESTAGGEVEGGSEHSERGGHASRTTTGEEEENHLWEPWAARCWQPAGRARQLATYLPPDRHRLCASQSP
jgi:hypothetical protein